MAEALAELRRLGVEWIAIHPYARIARDGTIRFTPAAATGFLDRAVELTRAAGMRLFWKPHLAYWGSFGWRGEIAFEDPEDRRRFFDGYRAFIVDQAAFAERAGAALFAVGVECEGTTGDEESWRRIIAEVREVYSGRITYAANWDRLGAVPFWDALDLIGVHAYFPLAEESNPSREALWRGWERPLEELRALSARLGGKRVVFAEIGYNRSPEAARSPWSYATEDSAASRELRRRLIEVALARIEGEPLVAGMFWWKWIPGDWSRDRDFSMRTAEAREALEAAWGGQTARSKGSRIGVSTPD